ncbi:MAG TPA: hypothetical protein DEG17_16450 [Cyanobacteria bacterium UBA11149]|nr:hypothetical protein [Cyanobacteria bacterium UBA11367]HBE57607.1 hypothetical protein [Cyanobacteria bacterium UBA11366]HBK65401.1 hypothetical protein [Cyanobacteria bacterium UBA11166]HBR74049.1 hypothetical protein [Cyanobacteria bacterium UBA11159]HBS69167.1 hypothetical protein [Cyanobacteria bacterium UBA11153]HBW90415.1 hypothetical protein [Cyanobacteria bacterium UBA11149]HCA93794.1 hypothetical protein [Cyanobacteria bacterium UBA9226]
MCPATIVFCLFIILLTCLKPKFFWESNEVRSMRYRLGDRGASIFYYAIGGGALAIGLIVLGR